METLAFSIPFLIFSITMAITPGPNNILLSASGAAHGFLKTVPVILGVVIGFFTVLMAMAGGLGVLFEKYPIFQDMLKYAGSAYLLYLAWKIATSKPKTAETEGGFVISFWQIISLQFVNPKAWIMAFSAMTSFTLAGPSYWMSAISIAMVFATVSLCCSFIWTGFGALMSKLLKKPRMFQLFNLFMALLLILTIYMIFRS